MRTSRRAKWLDLDQAVDSLRGLAGPTRSSVGRAIRAMTARHRRDDAGARRPVVPGILGDLLDAVAADELCDLLRGSLRRDQGRDGPVRLTLRLILRCCGQGATAPDAEAGEVRHVQGGAAR